MFSVNPEGDFYISSETKGHDKGVACVVIVVDAAVSGNEVVVSGGVQDLELKFWRPNLELLFLVPALFQTDVGFPKVFAKKGDNFFAFCYAAFHLVAEVTFYFFFSTLLFSYMKLWGISVKV